MESVTASVNTSELPTISIKNTDKKADNISEQNNHSEGIEHIRKILKPIKSALIDLFVSIARVLFFWLPGGDLAIGQALMVFHFIGGGLLYTIYFMMPHLHPLRMFIFFFFVLIVVQQVVFRACVITKAEQKLTGSNDTILDPWIRMSGFEPNRELRMVCNFAVVGCMSMTLLSNTILEQVGF
jgi:hypothetical protein